MVSTARTACPTRRARPVRLLANGARDTVTALRVTASPLRRRSFPKSSFDVATFATHSLPSTSGHRMRTFTARTVTTSGAALARTDIPRTPRLNREQRDAWVMAVYLGGATVEEIAFVLGSGRTSVRQCVMEAGLARHRATRNIDVLAILREVRLPGTVTLKEVAARIGSSEETVRH